MKEYAYLHCHTTYSISDAIPTCNAYVDKIYELNQRPNSNYHCKGWAVTDHGVVFALPKMYNACLNPKDEAKKINPVYGCEVYMCNDVNNNPNKDRYHLVLLASNQIGLQNLYEIASFSGLHQIQGRIKKFPTVDLNFLRNHGEGLICLTACVGGIIPSCIINGDINTAELYIREFSSIFDKVYLEVQPHDFPEQLLVNSKLVELSKKFNLKLVMTPDSHYLNVEDKINQDILKEITHQKPFDSDNHLYTPEEMEEYCIKNNIPLECITNTAEVYDLCCNVDLKPNLDFYPTFDCPDGYTENSYLRKLCFDALEEKIVTKKITDLEKYKNQLLYELEVVCSKNFAGYFLLLWDWLKWCRANNILTGVGRGSAAGCLISYLLDITHIDPIKNNLMFERFLNPGRMEPPDIDSDVPRNKRGESIKYFIDKYGKENVCQIITYGKYKLKNTTKAILSSLGVSFQEQNNITKSIPDLIDGKEVSWDLIEDYHNNPNDDKYSNFTIMEGNKINDIYNTYIELFKKYPKLYQGLDGLKNCVSNTGLHAGGVIISKYRLNNNVGLITGDSAILPVVQVEMTDIDFYGLLKLDILGVKNLDIIKLTMDLAGLDYDWYDSEDYTDSKVYDDLRDGLTCDIFQFSKFNPTKMIKDFNCINIEGLTAVNAGNRPGPLEKDPNTNKSMVDIYVEREKSHNIESIEPSIDEILKDTNGCLWYQEQCILLGQVMAGYNAGNADKRIRKTLGKKKVKLIPEIRNEFIYGKQSIYNEKGDVIGVSEEDSKYCIGAVNRGYSLEIATKIFDIMESFAKYSFNKSHSFGYAVIGYKDAWLAHYYPLEFAIANCTINEVQEEVVNTINNAKKKGIKVLGPDINKSDIGFSMDNGCIRYGLRAIKGLGSSAVDFLKKYRELDTVPFNTYQDYYSRIHDTNNPYVIQLINDIRKETGKNSNNPIKKDVDVALIMSGAFDSMEPNRYKVLNQFCSIKKLSSIKIMDKDVRVPLDEKKFERKQKLAMEQFYMGGYISEHPLDPFPYVDISTCSNGDNIKTTGIIENITAKKTKRGSEYLTIKYVCKDGISRNGNVFDEAVVDKIRNNVKKNQIVTIRGVVNTTYNNLTISNVIPVAFKKQNDNLEDIELPSKEEITKPVITVSEPIKLDNIFSGE